jgi:RNA polymerase sigma-70 factor, ECF subfamily
VVFLLREVEGLTTEETAVVANISISAAKVRLHRARLFLRERLAETFVALA